MLSLRMQQLFGRGVVVVAVYMARVGGYSPALLRAFVSSSVSVATQEAWPALRTDGPTSQSRACNTRFDRARHRAEPAGGLSSGR